MPDAKPRWTALAVVLIAVSVGCGAAEAPPPTGPTAIDAVFVDIPGFTVTPIRPADVDPALAGFTAEFYDVTAGEVSQNGNVVLKVFVAQAKSGSGDAFVDTYLHDLSTRMWNNYKPPKTVAGRPLTVGGHPVTHLHISAGGDGYTYAEGPTAVIAFAQFGTPPDTQHDAFAKILANL